MNMETPSTVRLPLQSVGNRQAGLPAKSVLHQGKGSSSPAISSMKKHAPSSMLSSSPPRSSRSSHFALTSSPGPLGSTASNYSVASSPPPSTPADSPRRSSLCKPHYLTSRPVFALPLPLPSSASQPVFEHVTLQASEQSITIEIGQVVHIGRKLKKLEESMRNSKDQKHVTFVTIPKAAKHASRHHCTLSLSRAEAEETGEENKLVLELDVVGQNGMQLEGVKIPKGKQTIDLGQDKTVRIGFFSDFNIKIVCREEGQKTEEPQQHVMKSADASLFDALSAALPSAPTSEATLGLDLEMDLDSEDEEEKAEVGADAAASEDEKESEAEDEEEECEPISRVYKSDKSVTASPLSTVSSIKSTNNKRAMSCSLSREGSLQPMKRARLSSEARSSPAPSPYAHQDDDGYPPEDDSSESEDEEQLERRRNAAMEETYLKVRTAINTHSIDLIGILASGIVFQPRATLTTTECVTLLLESQPSLLEHGKNEAWRPSVLQSLRKGPFGVIENEGLKDASGKKLEPDWHYRPDLDNDKERKASLTPFVKSIRSTQRQKKQYFFKRPSDLKNRRW